MFTFFESEEIDIFALHLWNRGFNCSNDNWNANCTCSRIHTCDCGSGLLRFFQNCFRKCDQPSDTKQRFVSFLSILCCCSSDNLKGVQYVFIKLSNPGQRTETVLSWDDETDQNLLLKNEGIYQSFQRYFLFLLETKIKKYIDFVLSFQDRRPNLRILSCWDVAEL